MEIHVDDRESRANLCAHLQTAVLAYSWDATVTQRRLECGDVHVLMDGTLLMVFERKTWEDLAASLRDGRVDNLRELCARVHAHTQVVYIIEGSSPKDPYVCIGRSNVRLRTCEAHLIHCIVRDRVAVWRSSSPERTAESIAAFADSIRFLPAPGATDTLYALPAKKKSVRERVFGSFRGIGPALALALAQSQVRIRDLLTGDHAHALENIPVGATAKVGARRAALLSLLHRLPGTHLRVLAAIPGVSAATAKTLLDQHPSASGFWRFVEHTETAPVMPSGRRLPARAWGHIREIATGQL